MAIYRKEFKEEQSVCQTRLETRMQLRSWASCFLLRVGAFVIVINGVASACSAFAKHQEMAITAEQLDFQPITVFRFVPWGNKCVLDFTLDALISLAQLAVIDGRNLVIFGERSTNCASEPSAISLAPSAMMR